jgi:ATP-dependent Clp protease ATP-binding subunit ClpA
VFERFTKEARRVVLASVREAAESGVDKTGPEHLLLCLAEGEGVGARVLAGFGVTPEALRAAAAGRTRTARLTNDEIRALSALGIDAEEVFRRVEEAFGPNAFDEPDTAETPSRRWRGRLGGPFGREAKKVLELSLREAIALRHRYIGSEHLLLAVLRAGVPEPMSTVLTERGVGYDVARQRTLDELRESA